MNGPVRARLGLALALAAALCGVLGGCAIALPWRAVDVPAARAAQTPVIIVVTQGRIRDGQNAAFDALNRQVLADMGSHPGLIGYSVRRELLGQRVWTITAWRDELALLDFTLSPAHERAAREGRALLAQMHSVQTKMPAADLPLSWPQALRWLEQAAPAAH